MLRVRVQAACRQTESLAKVKAAILQLFPDLVFQREDEVLVGTTATLERLRELIRAQRIRDTARGQLLAGREGERTVVLLSKQAAYMGVVNFAAGSALGEIRVEIESGELSEVIDRVAESTVDRPLKPSAHTGGT